MSAAASLKRNESLDSLRQRVASFVEERIMPIEADRANFDEHENIRLDAAGGRARRGRSRRACGRRRCRAIGAASA